MYLKKEHIKNTLFFILGLLFGLLVWIYTLEVFGQFPVPNAIWNEAMISKKTEICKSRSSKNIVFLGGSSVSVGINAKTLENKLNVPCINFGTNAGLGLDFMLWMIKPALKHEDLVVLTLEYELYDYIINLSPDLNLLYLVASTRTDYHQNLGLLDSIRMKLYYSYPYICESLMTRFNPFMPIHKWGVPVMDQSGEATYKFWGEQTLKQKRNVINGRCYTLLNGISKESESWNLLRSFRVWCEREGINIAVTWPNLCYRPEYENKKMAKDTIKQISDFWKSLDVPIIGDPYEAMLPHPYFSDTKYHLSRNGVETRTLKFFDCINLFLKESGFFYSSPSFNN